MHSEREPRLCSLHGMHAAADFIKIYTPSQNHASDEVHIHFKPTEPHTVQSVSYRYRVAHPFPLPGGPALCFQTITPSAERVYFLLLLVTYHPS